MSPRQPQWTWCRKDIVVFDFFFFLPVAPVDFMEALDGWPPPVSSAG